MSAGLQLGLQVIAEPLRSDRDAFKIDTRRTDEGRRQLETVQAALEARCICIRLLMGVAVRLRTTSAPPAAADPQIDGSPARALQNRHRYR
jgi:hypothetical protein